MNAALLLIAAYFIVLACMSLVALPYRRRMRELGESLCAADLNPNEREVVESLLKSAYSWRSSIILLLDYLNGIFTPAEVISRQADRYAQVLPSLVRDVRFHRLADAHVASAIAVNPFIGMFAVAARIVFRLKIRGHRNAQRTQQITDLMVARAV